MELRGGSFLAAACAAVIAHTSASGCAGCAPEEKPPVVEGEGGRWELLPALPGGPRQETAVVALRGEVVVLGGFNGFGAVVPDVEAYDPGTETWRRLADLPAALHHANGAVVDDKIVIAGFLRGAEFSRDGRVFIYDPDADAWSAGASMPAGTERGAGGVTAHGGFVYVFGGSEAASSARASRYDVARDTWEELPDVPAPLDHLAAVTIGDEIFIVGGRTNGLRNVTAQLLAFDPASRSYAERAPMPTARGGFAVSVVDGKLIVAGGEGNPAPDTAGVFPQTEAYDPVTDDWKSLLEMRTPRHGMGAAGVDGAMYVPGGADRQAFAAVDVFERFVPAPPADEAQ
jgi:N-acetylneuraminic acid mutarotase